jgi:hypothetical protein
VTIELLPGLSNVVRFPLEQRVPASLEVIFEIQPDCREVERVAEAFQLELPPFDLNHQVDTQTAAYIAEHVLPLRPEERGPALDELLQPAVTTAVGACQRAERTGQRATRAVERLLAAQAAGGSWLEVLEADADALTFQAAEQLIVAHQHCQEARGVARAVGYAQRGEAWEPFNTQAASLALIEDERRSRERKAATRP